MRHGWPRAVSAGRAGGRTVTEERLFDTGALFDLYKGRQHARAYFDCLLDGSLRGYVSVISEAEIWRRLRPGEVEDHKALLGLFVVLPLDSGAARLAGTWMQHYEEQGLGWMDALIVATARQVGLTVLTRDARLAACLADEARFEVYG